MNPYYPHLFSPLKVGKFLFKNRVMYAPHWGVTNIKNGVMTPESFYFFEDRARGGAAVVSTGENPINDDPMVCSGRFFYFEDLEAPSKTMYENTKSASKLVGIIRRHGSLAATEVNHMGKYGMTKDGYAISSSGYTRDDGVEVKAMDPGMMEKICDDYANCAERIRDLGISVMAIHAGHGWLLTQFLSRNENFRTDEFGGFLENRARFPIMVINSIRERVGDDLVIELRLSWEEGLKNGITLDETIEFCKLVDGLVDIVHVSVGNHIDEHLRGESRTISVNYYPSALNADAAGEIRKNLKQSYVTVVGAINDPDIAEKIIASGKADLVSIARQNIADPYFVRKAQEGKVYEIDSCIRCLKCYDRRGLKMTTPSCSVNPLFGREEEWMSRPQKTNHPRKVVVIGGGPAGLKAATTAAKIGHSVILFEKSDRLGGILKIAEKDAYKSDIARFMRNLSERTYKYGVDVRLGQEATPEMVLAEKPYAVIAAVGAEPIIPQLSGSNGENIMTAVDAYDHPERLGENIVIIGGGLAGCETAIHLAGPGRNITVLEMLDELARDAERLPKHVLFRIMNEKNVISKTGLRCSEMNNGNNVITVNKEGNKEYFKADTIIFATGLSPRTELANSFSETGIYFTSCGDCVKPVALREAIHSGYYAPLDIDLI